MGTWEQRHAAEVELERSLRERGLWKVYCAAWTAARGGANVADVMETVRAAAEDGAAVYRRSRELAGDDDGPDPAELAAKIRAERGRHSAA